MYTVQTAHGYIIAWTDTEQDADHIAKLVSESQPGRALFVCEVPREVSVTAFVEWMMGHHGNLPGFANDYNHFYYEGQRIGKTEW